MEDTGHFEAIKTREILLKQGFQEQHLVRYYYRPFDLRWMYWEKETHLLNRSRPEYFPHILPGNIWFSAGKHHRKLEFYQPQVTSLLADYHIVESNVSMFPLWLAQETKQTSFLDDASSALQPNLSEQAKTYLNHVQAEPADLFHHVIATLHSPAYVAENADGLRQDWPRVPLPASRELLLASAELGRQVAALLDSERPVVGVTSGFIRDELKTIGVLSVIGGGQLNPAAGDLDLTAGWGFAGRGGITMPGKGRVSERATKAEEEHPALGLEPGASTYDIALNERAYWRNIPPRVWDYTIGGYQVIKKWLSYRERPLLGRSLSPDEARAVTQIARRIAAILLLEIELDVSYQAVAGETYQSPVF
jgi:hypothetical protein